jgi:hypothetical protein
MNKRILELAKLAGLVRCGDWGLERWEGPRFDSIGDQDLEKFAELIIQEYAEELRQLNDGERVVLPKNREHAESMVRVGMHYLEQNK